MSDQVKRLAALLFELFADMGRKMEFTDMARWLHERGVVMLDEPSEAAVEAARIAEDGWYESSPEIMEDRIPHILAAAYRAEREGTDE
jgi:hypothetical protein